MIKPWRSPSFIGVKSMLRLSALVFSIVILQGCASQNFGKFEGDVVTKWLSDRDMQLVQDFAYIDPVLVRWDAPKGSVINGASIPQPLWSIIGGPFEGGYRNASVVHDVACDEKKRPWEDAHYMFYTACRLGGVGAIKAKIMYAGVYIFGPRWDAAGHSLVARTALSATEMQAFDDLVREIEARDPSIEEIRMLADFRVTAEAQTIRAR